jgi:putative phosphoribosyl transferase
MEVRFENEPGSALAGRFEAPAAGTEPFPVVVFAHGFGSGKDSPRGTAVASRVRDLGLASFLFDFTGHGGSDGSKAESTIDRQVKDLKAAVGFVQTIEAVDPKRIGVTGASSGGLVALTEALEDARVKALVVRGPRTDELYRQAGRFNQPLLIVQGELDPLLSQTEAFYERLRCEKELRVIPGADHLFSQPEQLQAVSDLTAAWFSDKLIEKLAA